MRRYLVLVVATLALFVTPLLASVDEIQLHVKGVTCPFCVYGIERGIKKLPGVVSVETTIRTGLVEVHVTPRTVLDIGQLQDAITKSGFSLDHIEATVSGMLVTRNERPALEATWSNQVFLLLEDDNEEGTNEALSEDSLKKLKGASKDGTLLLTITGRVQGHVATQPTLTVVNFENAA